MKIFFSSKMELANSLVNNCEAIRYAGAKATLIRINKLLFLLKNTKKTTTLSLYPVWTENVGGR